MARETLRQRLGRPSLRAVPAEGVVIGRARVDRRTKNLILRIQPGEIAVIDHEDIDRVAAEGLILAKTGGVVNAARSSTGRYPNLGPLLLAAAGIPVVDDVGLGVFTKVREGQLLEIDGTEVRRDSTAVATGVRHTLESLEAQLETARQSIGDELERFAENTLEYLRRERHLLTDSPTLPDLDVDLAGRHVLVVVRGGTDARADLNALSAYIKEMRPVMIGVDGGADVLLEAGHKPDMVIGDFDSVSANALGVGAQLIVHAYPGGAAPGAARLEQMGLRHSTFEAAGTSEDVAMLLAYEKRAELIVAVGTHASMIEFFDKGRAGMASTFLVRMRVGTSMVDAKGVSRLYQSRVRKGDMVLLVVAALFSLIIVTAVSQPARLFLENLWNALRLG